MILVTYMQENGTIRTKDGCNIGLRVYKPTNEHKKVILIGPSVLTTQALYQELAIFLQSHGNTVITFDYRGVGLSAPANLKGYKARMHQWAVQDIDAVIRYARNFFPGQELIFMGHGVGGELIGLSPASQYINRLVLINSALTCKKLYPWHDRLRMAFLKTIVRISSSFVGYFPGKSTGMSDNVPKGVMFEWIDWCNSNNGLFDKFPENNYRKLQVPLLAFSFSDDWRSPRRAVQELLNYFSATQVTWHHVNPAEVGMQKVGHLGPFNESSKNGFWQPLCLWIG